MPRKVVVAEASPEDDMFNGVEPVESLFMLNFENDWPLVVHTGKNPEKGINTTLSKTPGLTTLKEFKERILHHIAQDSKFGASAQFLPDNIYLATEDGISLELQYTINDIGSPFPVSINPSFVTGEGNTRGMLPSNLNSDVLLADLLPDGPIELHIYPLSAIIDAAKRYQTSGVRGATPGRLFHGYLRVYFPKLTRNPLETPISLDTALATELINTVSGRLKREEKLEKDLHSLSVMKPSHRPIMCRIRGYRRFGMVIQNAFNLTQESGLTLQSLFHKLPTSASIPFLRYIAGGKTAPAITKLYTISGLRVQIPYIRDHRVVRAWLGERRIPDPQTGRPISQITFKIEVVTTPKIVYATGSIFENGTISLTCETDVVIPPETILHVRDILIEFAINHGVDPDIAENVDIRDVNLELRWAPERDRPLLITESAIQTQLINFEPFFGPGDGNAPQAPTAITQTMKKLGELVWTRTSKRPAYSGVTSSALGTIINDDMDDEEADIIDTIKSISSSFEISPQISMFASSSEVAIVITGLPSQTQVALLQTLMTMLLTIAESGKIVATTAAPGSEVPLKKYYITQLKEADEALFEYRKKDSGQNQYSRKCGARVKRQPNVLTPEQYKRHVEEYSDDVAFWVYDPETYVAGTLPPSTLEGKEVVHFIKTTTKIASADTVRARESLMRYYFCPLYWCVYDNMMILKRDYDGTVWRNPDKKGPKPRHTCPFCGGKEVPSETSSKDGKKREPMIVLQGSDRRTVIMRTDVRGSPPRYPHIISEHPDDPRYRLPCCNARLSDIEAKLHTHAAKPFAKLFKKFSEVNILNADKNDPKPLAPGKLGMLRPSLREFFHRGMPETTLFSAQGAHRMVAPKRHAVLQVGLDNSPIARSYSFLSLLAFYAGVKEPLSIDDLVDKLMDFATPRIFQQLQYGRLVHEFYNETAPVPTDTELEEWCTIHKLGEIGSENKVYLQRLYIAYTNFEAYTRVGVTVEPETPEAAVKFKDWRIYAHLARLPGFLHPNGVQLILLEMTQRGGQKYRVLCPPGGVSDLDPRLDAPVAVAIFTPKYYTWEPLVLCDTQGTQLLRLWDMPTFAEKYKTIHEALEGMIVEYRAAGRCGPPVTATLGEGQLTSTELLTALEKSKLTPIRSLRDVYNQLRGYVIQLAEENCVFVPCVDDGTVNDYNAFYEKRGFPAAPAKDIIKFYESYEKLLGRERKPIEILVLTENALAIEQMRRSAGDGFWIVGVRLANGEIVPTKLEATTETALIAKPAAGKLPMILLNFLPDTIDRMLYAIDNPHWEISRTADAPETIIRRRRLVYEEVYQHIRIALASRLQEDTALRTRVEDILGKGKHHQQRTVPQKQREMLVLIIAAIRDIVVPVDLREELPPRGEDERGYEVSARLRRNCVAITDANRCNGSSQCAWLDHAAVCRVRAPDSIDGITEDPDMHIAKRISDELVRYPAKRDEIMENKIPRMPPIKNPMFSEHGELLFPELAADFTEFTTHYWKQPSIYRNHYRFYGDEGLVVESDAAEDRDAINELMEPENVADLAGEDLIDDEGLFNLNDE